MQIAFNIPDQQGTPTSVTINGVTYPLEPAVGRLLVALHLEKEELLLHVGVAPQDEMIH